MSSDPIQWLSARNPVPRGSTAPAFEQIMARIDAGETPSSRLRRFRLPLVPAIAVAATLVVVAVVVVLAVSHHAQGPSRVPPATRTAPPARRIVGSVPSPGSLMPRGGMRGVVGVASAASASPDGALVYFSQCRPCRGPGSGPPSHTRYWEATTSDGGRSWHVARTPAILQMLTISGADGWAEGLGPGNIASFFASHDGGRTWHIASTAGDGGIGDVSLAGGEVWTLGTACARPCGARPPSSAVMRGPAAGDRLTVTTAQPPLGDSTNVSVVATGRDDAYVLDDIYGNNPKIATITHSRLFATSDGGGTWRSLPSPCPHLTFGRLYAAGPGALWASCQPDERPVQLRRSTDGGRHWTSIPWRLGDIQLDPATAQVAWAVGAGGKVLRTADGGETWAQVWYGGSARSSVVAGQTPPGLNRTWSTIFTAQSVTTATVIARVTAGRGNAGRTNFVTYHTTDGGRTWSAVPVRLPSG